MCNTLLTFFLLYVFHAALVSCSVQLTTFPTWMRGYPTSRSNAVKSSFGKDTPRKCLESMCDVWRELAACSLLLMLLKAICLVQTLFNCIVELRK